MRVRLALALAALLPAAARAQDKPTGIEPIKVIKLERKEPVTYEKDIEPIFVNKCQVCHSGNVKEGRFDLSSYEAMIKGGKRGKPLIPGNGDNSLLYQVAGKTRRPFMPPKGETPLTPQELALIKLWIDQGARAPSGVREKPKVVVGLPPASVLPVRAVVISPDKASVYATSGNQIHVFDAKTGNHTRSLLDPRLIGPDQKPVKAAHLSLVESLALSPDGKLLASGSFQEVFLWDTATGQIKQKLTGFADRVVALHFSPDGKWLATGGGAPTEDGEVKVFEVTTGKPVVELKSPHSDTVFGVCFSPDGKMLATCGADKFVKTWDMPSGKFAKSFEGHTHHVMDVGWKSDGKVLASAGADNDVKVWDFAKGEQVRTIKAHGKQVTRLQFVGTTAMFATCSGDAQVKFWNADNGGNTRNFSGSNDFLYALGVSPDGQLLAVGGEEGIIRLYNAQNAQLLKTLTPPGLKTEAKK